MERYRLQQKLNFISTELHKGFGALFNPALPKEAGKLFLGTVARRLDVLAPQLESSPYLMGDNFSVADAYLFTVLSWSPHLKFDLSRWPTLGAYLGRIGERPFDHGVWVPLINSWPEPKIPIYQLSLIPDSNSR